MVSLSYWTETVSFSLQSKPALEQRILKLLSVLKNFMHLGLS